MKQRKVVNVPGIKTSLPGVTEKDVRHIKFGIEQNIDIIAQSFVRKAEDILEIKHLLSKHKAGHIQVIAKIENDEGVGRRPIAPATDVFGLPCALRT